MPTTALRTCPLCEATCGLVLELEGDRITGVSGDPEHPLSRGYICPKGAAIRELDHDPDRLVAPRIRSGDGWREVDWDEAFSFIADRLAEVDATHGRDAVGAYLGNPSVHTLAGQLYGKAFLKSLRPGFVASASTVDQMPKHRSSAELFGDPLAVPVPDVDRTDLLVVFGANPLMSNGSLWTVPDVRRRLKALQARGGRLVVVDPRRSRTAALADQHVAIRPGTDALMLAAMARTLLDEDLVEMGDLAEHVAGLPQLPEALAGLGPDEVAPACGVDADTIRALAREVAGTERAAVYGRIGTTTTPHGSFASWLVDVCNVLAGNLDRPGGMMFPRPWHEDRSGRPAQRFGRFHSRVSGHPEVLGEFPAAAMAEEIETPGAGQVRALFCLAGNPVLSTPDGPRLDAALGQLDLLVCVDPYVTATSRRADVILPPPALRHRGHADLAFASFAVRNVLQYTPPPLPLPDDQMAEEEILLRLAAIASGAGTAVDVGALDDLVATSLAGQLVARPTARTGSRTEHELLEAVAPRRGPERLLDLLMRSGPYGDAFGDDPDGWSLQRLAQHPHGVDLGPLAPRIPSVLTTTSGKVELAPPALVDDLPRLRTLADEAGEAHVLLVGRRHLRTNNSWMHNVAALQGGTDLCTLHLHPDDAGRWGIADGGLARVRSRTGTVEVTAHVVDDIRPGVVSLPHGFGHDLDGIEQSVARRRPGVNVNVLVGTSTIDPLSGTSGLTAVPVEVAPGVTDPGDEDRGRGARVDAVVLAGGASRRMGHDKAVLEVDERRLVDRMGGRLAAVVDRVVVASGSRSLGCDDEVADVPGVDGPLGGLVAGLRVTRGTVVVVAPVDAPYTDPRLLLRLAGLCRSADRAAAVAVVDGRVQALHLAVRRSALPAIEERVAAGERSPRRLLGWLGALRVDHDGWGDLDPSGAFAGDWDHPEDLPPGVELP